LRLNTPLSLLPGLNQARALQFARLGIRSVSDLIRHHPMRYERLWAEGPIDTLPHEGVGSTRGTITSTRVITRRGRLGKPRFQAVLEDHTGRINVTWFNSTYLQDKLHPGLAIRLHGKVRIHQGHPLMINPRWEPLNPDQPAPPSADRLQPIYHATEDLPSPVIEKVIQRVLPQLLPQISDPLPAQFVRDRAMPTLTEAFRMAHQPRDQDEAAAARRRLAYNELLLLQLGVTIKRHYRCSILHAPALKWTPAIDQHIRQRFPFTLTPAQDEAIRQIAADLQLDRPMNRLLQGDVGAGKTVVALYAMLLAVANRKQAALMAPTELLAEQHYLSIHRMLENSNVRLALLSAGQSTPGSRHRAALLRRIQTGQIDLIVGTQALLAESVQFHDLALVVIDEQHRFGVLQRAAFRQPTLAPAQSHPTPPNREPPQATHTPQRLSPHHLVMTATPIPRSLSLTLFGDTDISVISSLPPGRTPVRTRVVAPSQADKVYRYLAHRVAAGEQAYVVVPAIDAAGHETATELKNVRAHVRMLTDRYCPHTPIAAVHGRLKAKSRQSIMERFRRGETRILVATTVVEVGVDVPNATIMIVEHAERFGLAQLHQLRGRVGRGSDGRRSLCVFIAEPTTEEAAQRMQALATTSDGFQIAERDLQIRGMGDFFGTRQHGAPPLRLARIPLDLDLLQLARRDAQSIVHADPHLAAPDHHLLRQVLLQQYGDALGLIDVA
jgi:ATP-dependent DNA helicase RecG